MNRNNRFQISPVPNLNLERAIDIEDESSGKHDGIDERKVSLAQLTRYRNYKFCKVKNDFSTSCDFQ